MTRADIVPPAVTIIADDKRLKVGKPAPDPFLLAVKELRYDAALCVVFEDSPSGIIRAGVADGATAIAVCTSYERSKIENGGAHVIVDTMEQMHPGRDAHRKVDGRSLDLLRLEPVLGVCVGEKEDGLLERLHGDVYLVRLDVWLELREVVDCALAMSRGDHVGRVLADVEGVASTAAMESVRVPSWWIRIESYSSSGWERGKG